MRTSISGAMDVSRSIPLGIRVAVAGSRTFCRHACDVLASDPDVAFAHDLGTFVYVDQESARVHALIAEPSLDISVLNRDQLDWLHGISLIAVVGQDFGSFAGFANAQRFAAFDITNAAARLSSIKERVLQLRFQEFSGLVHALVADYSSGSGSEPTLDLDGDDGLKRVPVSTVDWIRAAGNHVEIRVAGRSHFHRSEMQTLERQLPNVFLRIHRKIIINLNRLLRIDVDSSVRQFATLNTGERFLISRHRLTLVHARLAEMRGQAA